MRIYIYILNPLSLALVANIACQRQISRRRHITCAVSANIDLLEYLLIRFHSCFTHEYRLPKANITPLGISLAPLAQISIYLLSPHPPPTRRRSARSSAEPPPFRHAFSVPPFPLSGKSTPQSSAKPRGRRLVCGTAQRQRPTGAY